MLTVQDRIKAINQKEKGSKEELPDNNNKYKRYRTTYIPSK